MKITVNMFMFLLLATTMAVDNFFTGCRACQCSKSGIVDGIDTGRPGCKVHIPNIPAFCYLHPDCEFPQASVSQAFSPLKWMDCVVGTPGIEADCDAATAPPTPPPTPAACRARGSWPQTLAGQTAERACPQGQIGKITRVCSAAAVWQAAINTCMQAPTCTDGIQNQDETGVDCGGATCPACVKPPACDDGIQNGQETGVDCGGTCKACNLCLGVICGANGNCVIATGMCNCKNGFTGARCQTPPPNKCPLDKCGRWGVCNDVDGSCTCSNGYQGVLCQNPPDPTCTDGIQNGLETGVDCGGPKPDPTATDMITDACPPCESPIYFTTQWGECSKPCDGGVQTRTVTCVQPPSNGGNEYIPLDLGACRNLHPVDTERACNTEPCAAVEFSVGGFGPCSSTCGSGKRFRVVSCMAEGYSSTGEVTNLVVGKSLCEGNGAVIPESYQACEGLPACMENHWEAGDWGECSMDCGGGTMTRTVDCMDKDGVQIDDAQCDVTQKPASIRVCNSHPCQSFSWIPCGWDDCTATCLSAQSGMVGQEHRDVHCMTGDLLVSETFCDDNIKPSAIVSGCNPNFCDDYNWMTGGWSPCVDGVQERLNIHCHHASGLNVDNEECTQNLGAFPEARRTRKCQPWTCPEKLTATGGGGGTIDEDADDGTSSASSAVPSIVSLVLGVSAMFFQSKAGLNTNTNTHTLLFAVCITLCVFSTGVSADDSVVTVTNSEVQLNAEDYAAVEDFYLHNCHHSPGQDSNGHTTSFPHEMRASFKVGGFDFEFDLHLMDSLFDKDYYSEVTLEDGTVEITRPTMTTYSGKLGYGNVASVTVHACDSVFAVISTEDDTFTIAPREHITEVDLSHRHHESKMFASSESQKTGGNPTTNQAYRRRLTQYDKFTCQQNKKVKIGFLADAGYMRRIQGTDINTNIQQMLGTSNEFYIAQMGVQLVVGPPGKFGAGNEAWHQCGGSASIQLTNLRNYRAGIAQADAALWHLMTDCWDPAKSPGRSVTIGIAYLGVLCGYRGGYNTGLSTSTGSRTWETVAHELGHNFGAEHSFENGQGRTGGIMDYGNNKEIKGVHQFNKNLRQQEICQHLNQQLVARNSPWCFEDGVDPNAGGGGGGVPPVEPVCTGTDGDRYPACAMWKQQGMCGIEVQWMGEFCPDTCCPKTEALVMAAPCRTNCATCEEKTSFLEGPCLTCDEGMHLTPNKGMCAPEALMNELSVSASGDVQLGEGQFLYVRATASVANPVSEEYVSGEMDGKPFSFGFDESGTLKLLIGDFLADNGFPNVGAGASVGFSLYHGYAMLDADFAKTPGLIVNGMSGDDTSGASLTGLKVASGVKLFGVQNSSP